MSATFKSIKKGLNQAIRHQKGERVRGLRLHVPSKEPKAVMRAIEETSG